MKPKVKNIYGWAIGNADRDLISTNSMYTNGWQWHEKSFVFHLTSHTQGMMMMSTIMKKWTGGGGSGRETGYIEGSLISCVLILYT